MELHHVLTQLKAQLQQRESHVVKQLGDSFWVEEHDVARVLYAVNCKLNGLPYPKIDIQLTPSGAYPLFAKWRFPWGAIPYPKEHAEVGGYLSYLAKLEQDEELQRLAQAMCAWHLSTLDHNFEPILSLFSQEGTITKRQLACANDFFFEHAQVEKASSGSFRYPEFGMVGTRCENFTAMGLGCGCKSGLGAFLKHDVGVLNFGPQLLPVGRGDQFGIAGLPHELKIESLENGYHLKGTTSVSSHHPKDRELLNLSQSGNSGLWIEAEHFLQNQTLDLKIQFSGLRPITDAAFVFFAKAPLCAIETLHRLRAGSLDRYSGPVKTIEFLSEKGRVDLRCSQGATSMEVIPLAGDDSFWGADFLVVFSMEAGKTQAFHLS
jgi:hypothetical protein